MELIPKSTHHPTNKKAPVRRLFDPEAFHTQTYKRLYKSIHTRVVMSYGKKWHTLPFRVFVCVCPPNLCPPMIYV